MEAEVLLRDLSTFMPQELRYSVYLLYWVQKYKALTPAELRNLVWAFATPQTTALLLLCFTAALLVLTDTCGAQQPGVGVCNSGVQV